MPYSIVTMTMLTPSLTLPTDWQPNSQPDSKSGRQSDHSPAQLVDARGLNCPLPLLKLRQALHQMTVGEQVRVLASDPNSQTDIRRYCERAGQLLLNQWQAADQTYFGFDIEKSVA